MMKFHLLKCLCLLLLAAIFHPCFGQSPNDNGTWFMNALRDKAGNLWFGTRDKGVYRYDAATKAFSHLSEADGLCGNAISDIYEDQAGKLWFATEMGICHYDGKAFTPVTNQKGLCHKLVTCITEDRKGNFWFGTMGYGVCRYTPATGTSTPYTKEQGLWSNSIECITEDKAGNLWFGERAGGASRYDAVADRFVRVNGNGCLSSQIMEIMEDQAGQLWFVNLYEGLCRYDPGTGGFTHLTEKEGLCGDAITCMYEDQKGNLWFSSGTNTPGILRVKDKGLCRYDGKTFTRFGPESGLGILEVWSVVEDQQGTLWVGGKGGLFRFHAPSGRFVEMTHKLE